MAVDMASSFRKHKMRLVAKRTKVRLTYIAIAGAWMSMMNLLIDNPGYLDI